LQLSRVGRVANVREAVSLAELAAEAANLVAGEIAERGVEVSIDPVLPTVYGDRTRLVTVFQNLIDNAVKYMGAQPEPKVGIGIRPEGNGSHAVFVRDNGSGIEERYLDQVFGLFERLSHDTPGTGVGLALVKRIVEVHGGRIWAESEGPGHGTCFCFTLGEESHLPDPSAGG
jgi:signal transduction histidine kinase